MSDIRRKEAAILIILTLRGVAFGVRGGSVHLNSSARLLSGASAGFMPRAPEDNATPMIRGAKTDQWPVVEILIDHGAHVWAHDEFGITAAQRTITSRILRGSDEDKARLRVIEKLKARGYPFPRPTQIPCSRSTRRANGRPWARARDPRAGHDYRLPGGMAG